MKSLPILTQSRARSFRTCARLHHLSYDLGYRAARETEPVTFGSVGHSALEAWHRASQASGGRGAGASWLEAALEALHETAGEEGLDEYERAKLHALLVGYHLRWVEETLEVLAVEAEFSGPLTNPETGAASKTWQHGGKLDAVVRDSSGRVLIMEHKFTGSDFSAGSDYRKRLRIDTQVSTYLHGARFLGYQPDAVLYDVVARPALRPYRATPPELRKHTKDGRLYANQREHDETPTEFRARVADAIAAEPEKFFARFEVARLEGEVEEAAADLWQTAQSIREAQRLGRHPRNADACTRYGSTCAFFEACTGEASLDDPALYRRAERPNEELTAA